MDYYLSKPVTRIGRESDNDILVPEDSEVSRYHAEIRQEGSQVVVRDLGSKNGTFLNEKRVTEHPLRDGDRIRTGRAVFLYRHGVLGLSGGAVASSGRHGSRPQPGGAVPRRTGNPATVAIVVVAAIAIIALAFVLARGLGGGGCKQSTEEQTIACEWVHDQTPRIVNYLAGDWQILMLGLPPNLLRSELEKQVVEYETWAYSQPVQITPNKYLVQATASFGIIFPDLGVRLHISADLDLYVDPATRQVTDHQYNGATVTEE